ncbi:hypothetical protein HA466_0280310 [Hirschfeldia incana]|nr:hypothetical protein HA466_0280310 [Hirschfeldia incana]
MTCSLYFDFALGILISVFDSLCIFLSMDSVMVEIAPPAFTWGPITLEIKKGFSGYEFSPTKTKFRAVTRSEGVFVKQSSKSTDLGFDDQSAVQAITPRTMGCNQTSTLNTPYKPWMITSLETTDSC